VSDSQLGRLAQQAIALAAAREAEPAAQQRRPTALPAPEAAPAPPTPTRTYNPVAGAPRPRSGRILVGLDLLSAVAVACLAGGLVAGVGIGTTWCPAPVPPSVARP
jgi:hypothetical protein